MLELVKSFIFCRVWGRQVVRIGLGLGWIAVLDEGEVCLWGMNDEVWGWGFGVGGLGLEGRRGGGAGVLGGRCLGG